MQKYHEQNMRIHKTLRLNRYANKKIGEIFLSLLCTKSKNLISINWANLEATQRLDSSLVTWFHNNS